MRAIRLIVFVLATASPAAAQQILLDKPVRAGDLVMFRALDDDKAYYYAPTHPRLATADNGVPQFSFFRWVDNVRSGAGDPEAREGEGGGIVHVLVTFGVPPEALTDATLDLRRQIPGARVAGPIVPKSATFTLVSSLSSPKDAKESTNKFATQVLGVGSAPILDGDKAAVSITLTKLGAKVLWEQFQTPTPDISFHFEMTVGGFLAPIRATVEADLDEIVKHDSFAAGVAGNFFGAQIKGAFDELRRTNVIKVTQVGTDAGLEAAIKTAYDKLVELLFDKTSPANAAVATLPAGASAAADDDWLKRATTQLGSARTSADAVRTENNAINARNADRRAKREGADAAEKHYRDLEAELHRLEGTTAAAGAAAPTPIPPPAPTPAAASPSGGSGTAAATGTSAPPAPLAGAAVGGATAPASSDAARVAQLRSSVEAARLDALAKRTEATKAGPDEPPKDVPAEPGFAIMATYQLKRSHMTGVYRVDLNKYSAETRVFPFDENIGDLRPLFKTAAFRQVNLDDPLYKQREIVAIIDGLNAEDFGQYVNFVSLRLRKKHESGELTDDEVRIDRKNFNQQGANFKMLYGWKGDNNRQRWMDYEYQAVWSFFGGYTIETPWTKWSANEIDLSPPLQRRSVELKGDPKRLADQGVRAVNVKVFYRAAPDAPEQVKQVTLNASAANFVGKIDFVAPKDAIDYEYEIAWRLSGNREVTSGRQKTSFTTLDVDELPKGTS